MLTPTPFDPGLPICVFGILVLVAVAVLVGRILVPRSSGTSEPLVLVATWLISGLVFLAGVGSVVCLERLSYVLLMPVMQIAFAVWSIRSGPKDTVKTGGIDRSLAIKLGWVLIGCVIFEWWNTGWQNPDGSLRIIHYDLGFYAQLVRGVIESQVADIWSATLGTHARESAMSRDIWYHWSPLWIAGAITKITGMIPLASLLHVVATTLDFALVLLAGAIVRTLSRLSVGRSLLIGVMSLVSVQLLRVLGQHWFALTFETDSLQHSRHSLAYAFSYKFEGMLILLAMLCWLRKQNHLAGVILACAAVSAPHSVAVGGVTAGVLGVVGVVSRNKTMWQTALGIILINVAVWAGLHFVFGVGLPKSNDQTQGAFELAGILRGIGKGLMESCTGLVLGALSLPGILHLIFSRDERSTEESRILGWMALSSVIGSFMGYHMLSKLADNLHFVIMAHAVIVMPVGVWGLARMVTSSVPWVKGLSITLLILSAGMGVADLIEWRKQYADTPWKKGELDPLKHALHGRSFGYYSRPDRPWWLPWHSSLAALLDVRCVRLNPIPGEVTSADSPAARPFEIVPWAGEDTSVWSLAFARHLNVTCILHIGKSEASPFLTTNAVQTLIVPGVALYELKSN